MDLYPFKKYSTKVPADWVDFNGHMNTKHYGLVLYDAHIEFTEHLDLGERYRYANNCSKALVETHCIFERELCEGDEIEGRWCTINKRLYNNGLDSEILA